MSAIRRAISTPRDGIPARTTELKLRIALDDFVRDPAKRARNCLRIHDRDGGG